MDLSSARADAETNIANRLESRGETIDNYFECVWVCNTCEREDIAPLLQKWHNLKNVSYIMNELEHWV